MAASDAVGAAAKAAPHFSIVSLLPAAVFTTVILAVIYAEPWTGSPQWRQSFDALRDPSFAQLAALAAAVVVIGLVLHPLQYPLIQFLEGYWGVSAIGLAVAQRRTAAHLTRMSSLAKEGSEAERELSRPQAAGQSEAVHLGWRRAEAARLRGRYPVDRADAMPTTLGNVLRRYERTAGHPYGLSIITVAPHLLLVGETGGVDYVRDQRTQLDLATRMCATCAMLTACFTVLLLPAGWWLLLAAIPYAFAWVFYRGACATAEEYGVALSTLMDLNREVLYRRVGLPLPTSLEVERDQNAVLDQVVRRRRRVDGPLTWGPEAASATSASAAPGAAAGTPSDPSGAGS